MAASLFLDLTISKALFWFICLIKFSFCFDKAISILLIMVVLGKMLEYLNGVKECDYRMI